MKKIENETFDEERALYGSSHVRLEHCKFDGPADGESALKESQNIEVADSYFNLRYPFWHDDNLLIENCQMTENCRAALWYTNQVKITGSKLHGIKALRECGQVQIENTDIISPEFGWSVDEISMKDSSAQSEYFMMRSKKLNFQNVKLKGKYSFQYIEDSTFVDCDFDTKDSFWHANRVHIKNSTIKGEYLAWYGENLTFENCTIIGTQPFCYCKNLKLINCKMLEADLAFEKSQVEATVTTPMISIKNPAQGKIHVPAVEELIMDDPEARGQVIVG
ncbi:MAG: DUF3737 family protein [Eubacterium sp.]|nr:DUF3737 family protein [Eubacterium sp.]